MNTFPHLYSPFLLSIESCALPRFNDKKEMENMVEEKYVDYKEL